MTIKPVPTDTLGSLVEGRYSLSAYCEACGHSRNLSLPLLIRKLGAEHSSLRADLAPKLVCEKCGARGPTLILSAMTGYDRKQWL